MSVDFSTVGSISANQAAAATAATASSGKDQLLTNYDTFLQLLTTQIKNQDPTEPLDAKEFTSQLVQYSTIEQQILTNESLEALITIGQSSNTDALVSYVGKQVEADGDIAVLEDGAATWNLETKQGVEDAEIFISDKFGAVVYSEKIDLQSGGNKFLWNGKDSTGRSLDDGEYKITIAAADKDGKPVDVNTTVTGIVTEVDFTGTEPALVIGDTSRVPLSAVLSVRDKT